MLARAFHVPGVVLLLLLCLLDHTPLVNAEDAVPSASDLPAPDQREIARGELRQGTVVLAVDRAGAGHLYLRQLESRWQPLQCEPLEGAWGLWLLDVDGDGVEEFLIALHKRAVFDPVLENRLHVYSLDADSCVPEWRGTRLAGRFDDLVVETDSQGAILVWERVARGERRVARYRWRAFGFALDAELWRGHGRPPARWRRTFPTLAGPRKGEP